MKNGFIDVRPGVVWSSDFKFQRPGNREPVTDLPSLIPSIFCGVEGAKNYPCMIYLMDAA